MKKSIILLVLLMLCLAFAATLYASGTNLNDAKSTEFGGGVYKPSTGVTVNAFSSGTAYCSASQHRSALNSNKGYQYATLSSSPAMPSATATSAGTPTECTSYTAVPTGFPTN